MTRWLLLCFALVATSTAAQSPIDAELPPEDRGRVIAQEGERRDTGFGDTVTELTMTLTNAAGRERRRRLTWQTLEVNKQGVGNRSLTVFHEPRDIAGTAFLSHTVLTGEDKQWLYLPALKRVKRIAASNRSSAFVGSEFAYEDLLSDDVERFDYLWLRDEPCGEWQCHVVERTPRYRNSGYSKQIVWIDQEAFRITQVEYYDRTSQRLKTLSFDDYRRYRDRYWRAHRLRMDNHQSNKSTVLDFSTFEFKTGLSERDFDPAVLRRVR